MVDSDLAVPSMAQGARRENYGIAPVNPTPSTGAEPPATRGDSPITPAKGATKVLLARTGGAFEPVHNHAANPPATVAAMVLMDERAIAGLGALSKNERWPVAAAPASHRAPRPD